MRNSLTTVCSSYIKRESPTGSRWGCGLRLYTESRTHRRLGGYFLDHDARSYELIARVFAGESEGLTRDDILDNITITWLTNTALSGARLYWENWGKLGYFNAKGVSIPVAVSVFPDELYPAPRSWAGRAYPKLIHYNKLEKGGHFAAWEQPQVFSTEVRAGFRPLRSMS
jgi:pimeloyl-ACP methyl ester carboxylesterase